MRTTLVLALAAFVVFSSCKVAFANEDQIGQSRLDPSSPFYFLKTIRENLELKFAGIPRVRLLRELEFATRRLREVKALMVKDQDLIPPTLEKYKAHLNSLPDKNLEDGEVLTRIKESMNVHFEVLESIYNQVTNPRVKMSIRAVINKLAQRPDLPNYTRLPICNFLSKEASSSALNDTEKAVLTDRAQKCIQIKSL